MDGATWKMRPSEEKDAARLAAELGIPPPIARILANRKISDPESARRFLYGTIEDLHDPYLMAGMKEAVERIFQAIERGEKILIFGDYDVDGVLSVVMLHKALEDLGAQVDYFIPERLKDGYGIKDEHIEVAAERGARLVISVDCGVKSNGFVRAARERGIDVIITDHHLPGEELPAALAVLDPVLESSGYPDRNLAGVGVAFKLIQALLGHAQPDPNKRLALLRSYMKLVAIGTVADVAKLTGENRIFVKQGLKELGHVSNIGLKSLIEVAGLTGKKISEGDIGFRLGPRINAAGRMENADIAVKLFFSESSEAAADLAGRLDRKNTERQATEERIYKQARGRVTKNALDKRYKILILGCEEWHRGIIGIVASKLKEAFGRPVILFSYDDGTAYGSGRSISEFSLINCLHECRDLFLTYGGHELAAGCTLRTDDLPAFKNAANAVADSQITDEHLQRKVVIDAKLDFADIDEPFLEYLALLSPFGVGNPRPLFLSEDVEVVGPPRLLKNGKHAKFLLGQNGRTFEALGWDKGAWADGVRSGDRVRVAFGLQSSTYLGQEQLTLTLAGMKK
ncbi:MAG: single-stranded-DNA-specific exonuclease RecJ [Candidatus Aminicenantes bacterium]|nr:single-stranded-DNA-specific exonuclease RecJ [Candidatus Aminicenantes bacterium]